MPKKICDKGHTFFKSSACPVCPICEMQNKPAGFLALFGAPARRALQNAGILSVDELSQWGEKDLLQLHGFGPSSVPIVSKILKDIGLELRK